MPATPTVNPTLCPLCQQPNQCAMALAQASGVEQPPCWCTQVTIEAALLSRIPAQAMGKACVCAGCVTLPTLT